MQNTQKAVTAQHLDFQEKDPIRKRYIPVWTSEVFASAD